MENEKNDIALIDQDNDYNDISNKIYFKLEYHGQKINDKNIEFLKWKKSMLKIYGENAKLFKCLKDDILFYSTIKDCKSYPFYRHTCPKCKEHICFYCSKIVYESDYYNDKGICCLKRRLKYLFLHDGYIYINPISKRYHNKYIKAFKYFITPIISFLLLSGTFQRILFERLAFKNGKINKGKMETYEKHLSKYSRHKALIINDCCSIVLSIPLFVIDIYFIIFILIISIPFKFIPLKYLLGLFYANISL